MGKETKKAQAVEVEMQQEQQKPQEENNNKFTAKVQFCNDVVNDAEKLSIFTDATFETIDFTTKEVKDTNIFGMKITNLQNQIKQYFPVLQTLSLLVGTNPINRTIIKLCLGGADITFVREYHEEGSDREFEGTYENDLYTTKIVAVKPNINELSQKMINALIEKGEYTDTKAMQKKTAASGAVSSLFSGITV